MSAQCHWLNEGTCNVAEGTTPGLAACSVGGVGRRKKEGIEKGNSGTLTQVFATPAVLAEGLPTQAST